MKQQPVLQKRRRSLAIIVEHIGDGVISDRVNDGMAPTKAKDLI